MAISWWRDAARASERPATLAHAISRMIPTDAINKNSGCENSWRSETRPRAALLNSIRGKSADLKMALGPLVERAAKITARADCACDVETPGSRRAKISIHRELIAVVFGKCGAIRP